MTALPITQLTVPTDRLELGIGQPDPALLPVELFQHLQADAAALAYGAPAGDGRFRNALAAWLQDQGIDDVSGEQLMVSNGSSNALSLLCSQLARPGDTVLVDDPTYFIARQLLAEQGLKLVPVPADDDGLDPQALARLIEQHRPAFCYCIPTFQNPGGGTYTSARRAALVEIARHTGCPLVADEVYQLLYFDQPPPPPLASFSDTAPVYSIGSFSKILAPGLRLGWIQAAPTLLAQLSQAAVLNSGGGFNPFGAHLIQPLLETGMLSRHLAQVRATLANRCATLVNALHRELGDRLVFECPQGGYFIWASWADGADSETRLAEALAAGVGYLPGARFSDDPDNAAALRLCFAFYNDSQLEAAASRLARALPA